MNDILKTIHWRAFFITFIAAIFLVGCYALVHYAGVFVEYSASMSAVTCFGLLSMLSLIPKILCYSVSIGAFLAFRKLADKRFLSAIISGLVIIIPMAVSIGCYDNMVLPSLTAKSVSIMWDVKMNLSPHYSVGDNFISDDLDFMSRTPSTTSASVLSNRLDSLQYAAGEIRVECGKLLAQLPDTMSRSAYEAYRLEQMGVNYQHAVDAINNVDVLNEIQQAALYDAASRLSETLHGYGKLRSESLHRMATAIWFMIYYLIFATIGYSVRKYPIKKTVLVTASAIISIAFINGVLELTRRFL